MKKFVAGVLVGILLMFSVSVFAEGTVKQVEAVFGKVKLIVNDKKVDKETVLIDGATYVPLRATAEMLGLEVVYDDNTATAYLNGAETNKSSANSSAKATAELATKTEVPAELAAKVNDLFPPVVYKNVKEFLASPDGDAFKDSIYKSKSSYAGMGEFIIDATDNKLILQFKFNVEIYSSEYINPLLDSFSSTFISAADILQSVVDQENVGIIFEFLDKSGNIVASRTYL